MAEEKIKIIIDGDSKGVVNASQQAESSISKLGKIIGGLAIGGGVLLLAKKGFDVLSDAIKGTIGFIQGCIDEAGKEQSQLKKLEQALISTSHFTKAGYKDLIDYASGLQKVTRYADEDIVSVEAQLAMFKLSNEEIKLATQATLDLAAAKDMDLQSASVLIGKVMVGEMGMLKRYGIILDENTIKSGDWRKAIEKISIAFGGQAKAQAETYLGSMDRLKNLFSDMKEQIGNAFLPTLTKLIDWFINGKEVIDPLTGSIERLASPFEKLKGWVTETTEAFGRYLELNWDNIIGLAESVFKKISDFITIVKEADYTKIQQGIEDLGKAFDILIGDEKSGVTGADAKYQSFIDNIGEGLQTLATFVAGVKAMADTIYVVIGTITNAIALLIEFLGAFGLWFISAGTDGQEEFEHLDLMIQAFKDNSVEGFQKMQDSWAEFSNFMNRSSEETTKEVKEDLESVKDEAIKVGNFFYPEITLSDNSEDVKKHLDDLQDRIDRLHGKTVVNTIMTNVVNTVTTNKPLGSFLKQSGGISSSDIYAKDLRIPIFKGEAVLPAELVRAIKENRGSFAGVGTSSSAINLTVNMNNPVIREEQDINKFADAVMQRAYDLTQVRGRLA